MPGKARAVCVARKACEQVSSPSTFIQPDSGYETSPPLVCPQAMSDEGQEALDEAQAQASLETKSGTQRIRHGGGHIHVFSWLVVRMLTAKFISKLVAGVPRRRPLLTVAAAERNILGGADGALLP